MKRIILIIIIAFVTYSCSKAQQTDFTPKALSENLLAIDNSQISFEAILNKQKGKITVIEVWASWCGDCIKAMPKIKKLQEDNPTVSYIFISMDKTADKWKEGIKKHQLNGLHYMANDGMKGTFGKAIDLDWIPRYIIIDKSGKIIRYRAIETDFDQINTTLQQLQ